MKEVIKRKILFSGILIVAFIGVTSCSSVINTSKIRNLSANYCEPTIQYDYSLLENRKPLMPRQDSLLIANLSEHDLRMSRAIGIEGFLATCFETPDDTLKVLMMKQNISNRVLLTTIEIDALAAELDCYAERVDQLANYVNGVNERNVKRMTIASVALDAVTTAAAIFTDNAYLAVGGGLASIGLGALTISPKGKKIELPLRRNLLGNVWYNNNDNKAFPNSIWTIINDARFSNQGDVSMCENIRRRWLQFEFENELDSETENLFFGKGGLYTADDLHARTHMTNELQAIIRTIKQDIKSLSVKVSSMD